MRVDHLCLLVEHCEDLVVAVAFLKVLITSLVAATDEVDAAVLRGDGATVQGHVELHLNGPFLEALRVHLVDVGVLLVPLERVNPRGHSRLEGVLHVVVDAQVGLNQIFKVADDLVSVLVEEALKLRDVLEFVKKLLKLCIEILKDTQVVYKNANQLSFVHRISVDSSLLHLVELE